MQVFTCYVWTRGVADAVAVESISCIPAEVETKQLTDVALRFIDKMAEHRHNSAVRLLVAAWAPVWPCKGRGS
jgi:hypothetical protein